MAGPFSLFGGMILTALGIGINKAEIDRTKEQKEETKRRNQEFAEHDDGNFSQEAYNTVIHISGQGWNSRGEKIDELAEKYHCTLLQARVVLCCNELEYKKIPYDVYHVAKAVGCENYGPAKAIVETEREKFRAKKEELEKKAAEREEARATLKQDFDKLDAIKDLAYKKQFGESHEERLLWVEYLESNLKILDKIELFRFEDEELFDKLMRYYTVHGQCGKARRETFYIDASWSDIISLSIFFGHGIYTPRGETANDFLRYERNSIKYKLHEEEEKTKRELGPQKVEFPL